MALDTSLQIKIGLDVIEVTKSINELEKEFTDLSNTLKTQTGQAFVDTNKKLERLRDTINQVKNIGKTGFNEFGQAINSAGDVVQKSTGKMAKGTDGAAASLMSLGQVARDLPFGFIAIQNNLPIVADQFGALIKSSKGLGPALKALGASMLGPAGITFAIGAVIAVVTGLIQKYGSLGGAIDALLKGGDKLYKQQLLLAEIQKEASKNAGDDIARFRTLEATAENAALSTQVRKDAIKELQEQYGAYLGNLTQEDILNGKLKLSTDEVTKALMAKAMAMAATAKLGKLGGDQLDILAKEEKANQSIEALIKKRKEAQDAADKPGVKATEAAGATQRFQEIDRVLAGEINKLGALRKSRKAIEDEMNLVLNLQQKATQDAGLGAISGKTQAEKDAEEAAKAAAKQSKIDAEKAKAKAAQAEANRIEKEQLTARLQGYEQEIKALGRLTAAHLDKEKQILVTKARIDLVGADPTAAKQIRANLEAALGDAVEGFDVERVGAGTIDFTPLFTLDQEAFNKRVGELLRNAKKQTETTVDTTEVADIFSDVGTKIQGKGIQVYPSENVQTDIDNMKKTQLEIEQITETFDKFLAPAIDTVFQAIESGQDVLGALGASFKRLIIQIAATVVKAAALAAIMVALDAATGGGSGAAMSFGKTFVKLLGGTGAMVPGGAMGGAGAGGLQSFSGVKAGGIDVSISGEFKQRGTDMVATIGAAQARINRVG